MPISQAFIDRFCHYFRMSASPWKTDKVLHCNFQWYRQKHTEFAALCDREESDDRAIVQFWLNMALRDLPELQPGEPPNRQQLALQHLSAFLQTTCYQVAQNFHSKYNDYLSDDCDLWECFALVNATGFTRFNNPKFSQALTNYQPERPSRLTTYFEKILDRILRAEFKVGKISDERLLYKAKKTNLRRSLYEFGERDPKISWIVFAHDFFIKVYGHKLSNPDRSTSRRYPPIEPQDYLEVCQYYNAYRKLEMAPRLVFNSHQVVTEHTIQEWLQIAITALRERTNQHKIKTSEFQDYLANIEEEDDLEENNENLFMQEIEQYHAEVMKQIKSNRIPKSHLAIPFLYYGLGISQQKIAPRCHLDQGNVSKHLSKYCKNPVKESLQQNIRDCDLQQYISCWLFKGTISQFGTVKVDRVLDKAYNELSLQDKTILKCDDASAESIQQAVLKLSCSEAEVKQRLEKLKAELKNVLDKAIKFKIKKVVDSKLSRAYQSQMNQILTAIFRRLDVPSQSCLISRYVFCTEVQSIAIDQNLSCDRVEEIIWEAKLKLRHEMVGWMQEHLDFAINPQEEFPELDRAIENWLTKLHQQQLSQ